MKLRELDGPNSFYLTGVEYRVPTALERAQAEVNALRSQLHDAEVKLSILGDPWYGLEPGQARVRDGFVYTLDGVAGRRVFKVV